MIKQTQTKMFDFSDTGLDFSAGSKTLFPDRFKKMLVQGYNLQTASSVSVSGDQVTLSYGAPHGYVADRVLKVEATGGFNKEVYIDSVTSNTVTFTENDTSNLSGVISTKVAPLGYELVYEQANIHIYKFKHIDDTDMYLRLCFQDIANRRNCISPCIGRTADLVAGTITDVNALSENTAILSPGDGFKWEFSAAANSTYNSYTYTQGYSTFGLGMIVGSLYHFAIMSNVASGTQRSLTNGFFPTACLDYEKLKYPVLLGYTYGSMTGAFDTYEARNQRGYIGNLGVVFDIRASSVSYVIDHAATAANDYLPAELDNFNTTTAEPLSIYDATTRQRIGLVPGGVYRVVTASTSLYPTSYQQTPSITQDIDFEGRVLVHAGGSGNAESTNSYFLAFPIEEIKIA